MQTILTIIAAIIPFQFALNPATGVDVAVVRPLIAIATFLWITTIVRTRTVRLAVTPVTILLGLFLLATVLSAISARDIAWFLRKEVFLFNFAALFVIVTGSCDGPCVLRLLRTTTASGVLAAIIVIAHGGAQFLFGPDTVAAFWHAAVIPVTTGATAAQALATYSSAYVHIGGTDYLRAAGFFPDPHVAAFFLAPLIPLAIGFGYATRRSWRHYAWYAGALLLTTAIVLTFTRGAYIGLCVGTFLGSIVLIRHLLRRRHYTTLVLTFLCLLVIGTVLLTKTPLGTRLASAFTGHDTSITERFAIWHEAVDIIDTHPLTGIGIGNYPLAVAPTADYRDPYYAHNLFLDVAVEAGVPAAILLGALLLVAAWRCSRDARWAGASIGILMLLTHSMFDTPLWSVHVLPLLMILLSAAAVSLPQKSAL